MSTFYLVRHAHADWTPNKARSLSKQGCRDAERGADILQSIATNPLKEEIPVHERDFIKFIIKFLFKNNRADVLFRIELESGL